MPLASNLVCFIAIWETSDKQYYRSCCGHNIGGAEMMRTYFSCRNTKNALVVYWHKLYERKA